MATRHRGAVATLAAALSILGCSPDTASTNPGAVRCTAGTAMACVCPGGATQTTTCSADGAGYLPCACGGASGSFAPASGSVGPVIAAAGWSGGLTAGSSSTAGKAGGGGRTSIAGISGGLAGRAAAASGSGSAGNSGAAGRSAGSAGVGDLSADELSMLRQTCVDEINRYRAMLPSLKVLKRATAAQEMCSDSGAQMDGDSGMAHGSARAGLCRSVGLGAEDTCPDWGVGGFTGNATVADALKNCLKAMWGEGEPPVSRSMCVADYAGCFEKYGHYLNMSDPAAAGVACSFYKMKNGHWWMNQDFTN